jgi:nucleotide-binding universal stress UspA family protein
MKNLLVHLDASPRAAVRLALAQSLARQHGAELQVLYGVLPSLQAGPWAVGDGISAAAAALADLDREQRERARALFDRAGSPCPTTWIEGGSTPYTSLLDRAPYADLMVLGQHDRDDLQTGALPPDLVPSLIVATGRPALVVPFAGQFQAAAGEVLLAWKPTREAARAVTAALPWLRLARTVHVAMRDEGPPSDFDHMAALRRWLASQGVAATVRSHGLGPGDVGAALLSLAADTGAELLVMGCYGHSRAREWILGGASYSILRAMTLPVLMVH